MKVLITTVLYIFYALIAFHLFIIISKSLIILRYRDTSSITEEKGFSIVVAAHNEAQNLKHLIPVLLKQTYNPYEVIIALDRCSDQSHQVTSSFNDERLHIIEIKEVPENFQGKKFALSKAIGQAKFEWILLTDADCRPASDAWIRLFNRRTDPGTEFILGLSPYTRSIGPLSALIGYETFQTAFNYVSAAASGHPYMGVGRNLAYKKSVFLKSGGFGAFKQVTGGDDDLFVQQHANHTNTRLILDPRSLTYSAPKRKWKEYLQQKIRHLSVGKHYRSQIKVKHFVCMSIHLLLWFCFLYLIFNYSEVWRIIGVFGLLLVVKGFFFTKIAKKTGLEYSILWYPIVDFSFAVVIPLVGTRAVFVKNIKWS